MAKRKANKRVKRRPQNARAIEAALAGIAHDIRTPLTGIVALAELLASSDLGTREREWANAVKSGADHLAALTTLIVDAAKAEATGLILRNEPFSPRALAQAVGQALVARAGNRNVKAEIAIARDLPAMVAGDALRLRAALENLADNAVKFTHQGGVSFSAAAEPAARGRMRLDLHGHRQRHRHECRRIETAVSPLRAGERADRAALWRGRTGAHVRQAYRQGDGRRSQGDQQEGQRQHLPSHGLGRARRSPNIAERSGARARPARELSILCAEDNPYGRVVMNTIIAQLGHRVDFVESGEAAVKAAISGGYDAVLMDITLSGLDGIEATRRIRALPGKAGQVPVIGISGRSESGSEQAARAAGMNFYFAKPVSPGKLAEALKSIG